MKNCCDNDCNQGRNCPYRQEADFTPIADFLNRNYVYLTSVLYAAIVVLLLLV